MTVEILKFDLESVSVRFPSDQIKLNIFVAYLF